MKNFWDELKSGKFAAMVCENAREKTASTSIEIFNIIKPLTALESDVEQFWCLFLDNKNHILAIEKLFTGSISSSSVYPREVIKKCLYHQASAVIFAHNHPSGDPNPSREDLQITKQLFFALAPINVMLHDHVIIGNTTHYSMTGEMDIQHIKISYETATN